MIKSLSGVLSLLFLSILLQSCTVVKVVDITAGAALGLGKGAVKAGGAVAGAAIPNGAKEEESD